MTRRMLCLPIVFLLVIPAIVQGAAQQTPSRNRGIVVLADSPAVHQELKLVEQQVARVTRAVAAARAQLQQARQGSVLRTLDFPNSLSHLRRYIIQIERLKDFFFCRARNRLFSIEQPVFVQLQTSTLGATPHLGVVFLAPRKVMECVGESLSLIHI